MSRSELLNFIFLSFLLAGVISRIIAEFIIVKLKDWGWMS